jgi:predicted short-subunit dehydrogenase-like oxidoreductase (DUF2520 family)
MQVTIIGSGNIGTVMGRIFMQAGHTIKQVYSRNAAHAAELAIQLKANAISDLAGVDSGADIYLLAVTDDALPAVASELSLGDSLVIHTAGSVSKEVLKNVSKRYGVLWPVKMIRKSMTTLEPVSIVVDGNTAEAATEIENIARLFSPTITRAGDAERVKMHMLAAVTTNFPNHLYHLAADYCAAEKIDFSFFYPLIEETARQIKENHPKQVQAGPAFRGDRQTLQIHEQLLEVYPQLQAVYKALSGSISQSFGGTGGSGNDLQG